jgi:hypothetical protein
LITDIGTFTTTRGRGQLTINWGDGTDSVGTATIDPAA